jgi:hypothetical protein
VRPRKYSYSVVISYPVVISYSVVIRAPQLPLAPPRSDVYSPPVSSTPLRSRLDPAVSLLFAALVLDYLARTTPLS